MHFSSSSSSLQPPSFSMPRAMEAMTLLISRGLGHVLWRRACRGRPRPPVLPGHSWWDFLWEHPLGIHGSPFLQADPQHSSRPQSPKASWEKLPKGKGLALVLTCIGSIGENPSTPDHGSHLLQANSKGTRGKTPKGTLIAPPPRESWEKTPPGLVRTHQES